MTKRKRCWSESFGPRGFTVRVFERVPAGTLWYEHRDSSALKGERAFERGSLCHNDRTKARQWALRRSDELRVGCASPDGRSTLARIFALYLQYATPSKSATSRQHDKRCAEMFTRLLGAGFDLEMIDSGSWERFKRDRATGALNPQGVRVSLSERFLVRPRTVRRDLEWLRTVISWARKWRETNGQYLLESNPTELFDLPRDDSPRRPIATQDRFEKVRAAADQVLVQTRRPKWRRSARSYLLELLDLANETGRRMGAIRQLRIRDLNLKGSKDAPRGLIHWPKETDKLRREWVVPISGTARTAINALLRNRPNAKPEDYLFPSPSDPAKPVSKELTNAWLREAEQLAGVEKQDGSLWHAYRRKWGSERKEESLVDVAYAGGWADTRTLQKIYQQVDDATLYEVVSQPKRLREAR